MAPRPYAAANKKAAQLARIHAIWGLGQGMRFGKVDTATLLPLLAESDTEIVTQSIKMLGDVKTSGVPLVPLLAHPSQRVRFHAAIALGKLQEATAFKALLNLATKESADPYMHHAIVTGLAKSPKPPPCLQTVTPSPRP